MTIASLSLSVLRPLRPVLLAGAAAVAWLAVSAPAADADNSPQSDSLGSTISSAVSSVNASAGNVAGGVGTLVSSTAHATRAAAQPTPDVAPPPPPAVDPAAIPEPLPATLAPAPAEQPSVVAPPAVTPVPAAPAAPTPVAVVAPVVADIVEPLDAALGGLPLGGALPDDTVAEVTDPVVAIADETLTDAGETVLKPVAGIVAPVTDAVGPVTDALPVELPVGPVTDVLTQILPLADPIIEPLAEALTGTVAIPDRLTAAGLAETGQIYASPGVAGILAAPSVASAPPGQPAIGSPAHHSHMIVSKAVAPTGPAPKIPAGGDSPSGGDRTPTPEALLPAPASGSGSGTSSGGPSASAAWLNSSFEYLPLMGFVPASGPLQHVPSPVANDPGSRPD